MAFVVALISGVGGVALVGVVVQVSLVSSASIAFVVALVSGVGGVALVGVVVQVSLGPNASIAFSSSA